MPRDRDDDIVRIVLRACVAEVGMPMDIARQIDRAVRDMHGGKRYYIARPRPAAPAAPRRKPQRSPLPASWDGIV